MDSTQWQALLGTPEAPTPKSDVVIIAQKPDCSAFLVLSGTAYAQLVFRATVPAGFDFTYAQWWGLTINDAVIARVEKDLADKAARAEALVDSTVQYLMTHTGTEIYSYLSTRMPSLTTPEIVIIAKLASACGVSLRQLNGEK